MGPLGSSGKDSKISLNCCIVGMGTVRALFGVSHSMKPIDVGQEGRVWDMDDYGCFDRIRHVLSE